MKISVVGMGNVGSATAHALVAGGMAEDLVLTSRNVRKAEGEAMDLDHAGAILPHVTNVRGGEPELTAGSGIVILTHSVPTEKPGRKLLAAGNGQLFRDTLPLYAELSPDAVFVILSNPVDALTWLTIQVTNLPAQRVIGAGTIIDSARLRAVLSDKFEIHPDDLRVYVLGEHGEAQFPAVSLASTGGVRFKNPDDVRQLFEQARKSPWEVFERKGYTNMAVAHAAALIARTIRNDQQRTLPVSTLVDGYLGEQDVCLSLPCVVGHNGVQRVLYPDLPEDEVAAFHRSAESVRETIGQLG